MSIEIVNLVSLVFMSFVIFGAAFEPPLGCMTILVVSEIESVVVNKVVSEPLCSSKSEDIL